MDKIPSETFEDENEEYDEEQAEWEKIPTHWPSDVKPPPGLFDRLKQKILAQYPESSEQNNREVNRRNVTRPQEGAVPPFLTIVLAQLARLDAAVALEFDRIGNRMLWLVLSESFIFSTFATVGVNYTSNHYMHSALTALLILMPFLGIVIAALVYPAILAAHSAAQHLKRDRQRFEKMIEREDEELGVFLISARDQENTWGNIPSLYLPPTITLIWLILLTIVIIKLFIITV